MKHIIVILVSCWLISGCKEKYEPPIDSPALGYLVVEGFISPSGPSEIRLSRTIPLNDSVRLATEKAAQVRVEGSNGSNATLNETAVGVYVHPSLNLNPSVQYRLYIKTREGKEYASDFLNVRRAPEIDNVSWERTQEGVWIFVETHDPQNATRFYRWDAEETWEFHSLAPTELEHAFSPAGAIVGVKYRKPDKSADLSVYYCWQHEESKDLILGSTEKLSEDRIRMPVVFIPNQSWKLGVLYSVNVNQYALTKPEYDFLKIMKRNSEETGSVFDPQPSELKGNLHCLNDAAEPVIGALGITTRSQRRIFINNSELPAWNYVLACSTQELTVGQAKDYPNLAPIGPYKIVNDVVTEFTASDYECVDCRTRGSNAKPSFWP